MSRKSHKQKPRAWESDETPSCLGFPGGTSRITKDLRSRATPQSSACTRANMICLRHPLTPAAAAGLVLAALARGQA